MRVPTVFSGRLRRIAAVAVTVGLLGAGTEVRHPDLTHATNRIDPEVAPIRMEMQGSGASVTPFMSDAFANSFGVNTRFETGIYAAQRGVIEKYLVELGFRHIRDGNIHDGPDVRAFLHGLCAKGIHPSLGLDDSDSDAAILEYIRDVPCVDMVEGPNELNGKPDWLQRLATFMPHVYSLIHHAPAYAGVPVVGPSITRLEDGEQLGKMVDLAQYVDYANKHSYPGQRNIGGDDGTGAKGYGSFHPACPSYGYGSFFYDLCVTQTFTKDKPIWTTETGYSSTPKGLGNTDAHPPYSSIPYDVAVKYFPRLMAYEFLNGITRTYIFALMDGASGCNGPFNDLGLIEQDCPNTGAASSIHPKPQFYALESLYKAVSDAGPAFTTNPVTLSTAGGDTKLQTLLLQKRSGKYLMLFWVEASDWNVNAGTYAEVKPEQIRLRIGGIANGPSAQTFGIDANGALTPPAAVDFAGNIAHLTATDSIQFLTFGRPGR